MALEFPATVQVVPLPIPETVIVPVAGPTGPPGPAGPEGPEGTPGGSAYEYTQTVPASTWIIDHNLGRKVHVSIFSTAEFVVFADVFHGSPNQTTITYPTPTAGSVVIS